MEGFSYNQALLGIEMMAGDQVMDFRKPLKASKEVVESGEILKANEFLNYKLFLFILNVTVPPPVYF